VLTFFSHSKYSGRSQQEFMGCYQWESVISSFFSMNLWGCFRALQGARRKISEATAEIPQPLVCCKKMREHGTLMVVDFKTSTSIVACFRVIWSLPCPLQNVTPQFPSSPRKRPIRYILVESTGTTLHWTRINLPVGHLWLWFTSWVFWDATETLM